MLRHFVHWLGRSYISRIVRREYDTRSFRLSERPIEYRFVLEHLTRLAPMTVLDVGSGNSVLPCLMHACGCMVTAIDNFRDYWTAGGFFNWHYHVLDDDIRRSLLHETFDLVTCISALEHIRDHQTAIAGIFARLNPGGHLVITCPYNEWQYIDNVYLLPGAGYGRDLPYICRVYSRAELDSWLSAHRARLIIQEYWKVFTGDYWTFGERLRPPVQVGASDTHHLTCLLIQKRV